MSRHRIVALGLSIVLAAGSAQAQTIDVVGKPIPQAYKDTCQSYALAFALARAGALRMETVADLRAQEARVRKAIDAEADRTDQTPYHHSVWQGAVKALTGNTYALHRKEFSDVEELMRFIEDKTGIRQAATLGPVLSAATVQTPVMTSFSSIGPDTYATGHIVTILGSDGRPNTQRQLLLLNSAVKGPSTTKLACDVSDFPGDYRYRGAAALEQAYNLKRYGGKFIALWTAKAGQGTVPEAPKR